MIQAHVVTSDNQHLYEHEFEQFLRRRHDIFVRQKSWRPESPDGREVDEFDTDAATYILGMEDGDVVTSARLIPTSQPHLVSEMFPHMCERAGVPCRPDWAEWTRTYVVPSKRSASRRGTLTELCCAVMEFALEEGISAVGGIQETPFMSHHRVLKWQVMPLGRARDIGGENCIVAYIQVDEDALKSVRRLLRIDSSLLVRRGLKRPFVRGGVLGGAGERHPRIEAIMA
ncbi:acyl-homoserine-lactone synthase [Mesorhizobium helmanticense]|uniref:Acyl-homoserine-lactone synthase n=1 Tax=Mesorhizobium helmanticense TaxID=1776423 RepID=A0A2T4ILZ1_9HYPH|nr:acyl-homoserine-lactone synthase [Mesorhizobium helmanticense]PTE06669.1 autoinducer synthase [Mesorhizobium helmanticense]